MQLPSVKRKFIQSGENMMDFDLSPELTAVLFIGHIFTEHVGFKPGEGLRSVGPVQYLLHWVYAVLEPSLMRAFNFLLKVKFVTETKWGLRALNLLCKSGAIFPHCICVTTGAAERFVDYITEIEGPKGARLAVGPCVCQRALGCRKEPYIKDMVVLYGADIYYHLNVGYRLISADEAKAMLKEFEREGLVHFLDLCMRSGKYVFVICNCDTEICPGPRIYRLTKKFLWPGPEILKHDPARCIGPEKCGKCLERCIFDVNTVVNGEIVVDYNKCMGCGLCIDTCMGKARSMAVRDDYAHEHQVPAGVLLEGRH
jgi:ferredoxin